MLEKPNGALAKEAREQKGYLQKELSGKRLTLGTISKIENGKHVSSLMLRLYENKLGVPSGYLSLGPADERIASVIDTTASVPEIDDTTASVPEIDDTTTSVPEIDDTTTSVPEINQLVDALRIETEAAIEDQCGKMRVLNTETRLFLDALYTEVYLLSRRPAHQRLSQKELLQTRTLDLFGRLAVPADRVARVEAVTLLDRDHRVVLYGQPGSGKTTLLKRLALDCSRGKYKGHLVPVFLKLADLSSRPLEDAIRELWRETLHVDEILRSGRILLLLDGLDEVRETRLDDVRQTIERFVRTFPLAYVAISCRVAAGRPLHGFSEVELADFNWEQVTALVSGWFAALGNPQRGVSLLERIAGDKVIAPLTRRPLLLTMLCVVFNDRGHLHDSQVDLYEDCLDILLRGWDESRKLARTLPSHLGNEPRRLLEEIAFRGFSASTELFSRKQLDQWINEFIHTREKAGRLTHEETKDILESLEAQVGLFVEQSVDLYSFSHRTFQEYLASCNIARRKWLDKSTDWRLGDLAWIQVWKFALSGARDPDALILQMSRRINDLAPSDDCGLRWLQWSRSKAEEMHRRGYSIAALRSHYLCRAVLSPDALDFTMLPRNLDLRLAAAIHPHSGLDPLIALDRELDSALCRAGMYNGRFMPAFAAPNLEKILVLARVALPIMIPELDALNAQLIEAKPNFETQWVKQLQHLAITHRNVGHYWPLSETQHVHLNRYYNASMTMLDCMLAASVSASTRSEIERTVFIPLGTLNEVGPVE